MTQRHEVDRLKEHLTRLLTFATVVGSGTLEEGGVTTTEIEAVTSSLEEAVTAVLRRGSETSLRVVQDTLDLVALLIVRGTNRVSQTLADQFTLSSNLALSRLASGFWLRLGPTLIEATREFWVECFEGPSKRRLAISFSQFAASNIPMLLRLRIPSFVRYALEKQDECVFSFDDNDALYQRFSMLREFVISRIEAARGGPEEAAVTRSCFALMADYIVLGDASAADAAAIEFWERVSEPNARYWRGLGPALIQSVRTLRREAFLPFEND